MPGIVGHNLRDRAGRGLRRSSPTSWVVMHSDGLTDKWDLDDYPGLLALLAAGGRRHAAARRRRPARRRRACWSAGRAPDDRDEIGAAARSHARDRRLRRPGSAGREVAAAVGVDGQDRVRLATALSEVDPGRARRRRWSRCRFDARPSPPCSRAVVTVDARDARVDAGARPSGLDAARRLMDHGRGRPPDDDGRHRRHARQAASTRSALLDDRATTRAAAAAARPRSPAAALDELRSRRTASWSTALGRGAGPAGRAATGSTPSWRRPTAA